ncbi:MAG: Phospholipid/cholesterol/gamma-HCH transport system substrate-binding protein [Marmoricola sp.]|nr:Phospholipid/cholesterol/gamma-HCH transport system substrate-binding protein [Marmoricola sp.]
MLNRSVYVKLVLFVLITLVGISYVSANYIGLTPNIFASDNSCTIHADFPDSGGIFSGAEVTYRGVGVGKVGSLNLIKNGVEVDLKINNCKSPAIPTTTAAAVSDRSVIGEQYVNLIPPNAKAPYMHGGEVIPMSRDTIPISAEALLTNLDTLVNSVDTTQLASVVSELGKAFNDAGPALGTLLDSTNNLLKAATAALPATEDLIDKSSGVLQTQLDESSNLQSFTHSLNLLSQQLKTSNPDIKRLLSNGPSDLQVVQDFVNQNKTDLGVVLADLASTGKVLVRHLDGLEEILELYPALVAGGESVIKSDDTATLGLVINNNDPPDCGDPAKASQGYGGTQIRPPTDLSPKAPNVDAHCTASVASGTDVRGSQNVPGGDPISATGGGIAYPRGTTENTVSVGTSLDNAGVLADDSWVAILTAGLN